VSDFDWSSIFKIDCIGAMSIRCKHLWGYQEFIYYRIERKKRHETFYVTISEENKEFPEYMIQNNSKQVTIKYW